MEGQVAPARNIDMALLRSENMEILKRVNQLQALESEQTMDDLGTACCPYQVFDP